MKSNVDGASYGARIADSLERIADALEAMRPAEFVEPAQACVGKPFPFNDRRVPARFRNGLRHERKRQPLETFEDLIRFGKDNMLNLELIGEKTLAAIDPIFEENGYGQKWRDS